MPLPNGIPTIDTSLIQVNYSQVEAGGIRFTQKFIPHNSDGTIYDCSAATSALMYVDNGLQQPFKVSGEENPLNIGVADATGIVIEFLQTFGVTIANCGSQTGKYLLMVSDGTSIIPLAAGKWQMQLVA